MDNGSVHREIACFVKVAHYLSFSRAATELGLSQPAVSQAIARLERRLGLRLFERTSREVRPSDEGKVLLPYAEELLDRVESFMAEASRLATPAPQPIRLAYCPLVGGFVARVVRRLAQQVPAIDVELVRGGWGEATNAIGEGAVSAALMATPHPPGLASTARFHVPITHLALPLSSPLARAQRVSMAQLDGVRLLMPRGGQQAGLWSAAAASVRAVFVPADLDDLTAALDLVAAGRGALLAPHLLVETVRRPDVSFVPLVGADGLRMTYGLVWHPDRASADVMALIQTVRSVLRPP